jgi:methylsterol monooxygenase
VGAAFKDQVVRSVTNPLILWAVFTFALHGRVRLEGPMDSWPLFATKMAFGFLIIDAWFYWGHRLSHHAAVYQYVHKQHHRFKVSCGAAFEYAHPAEALLVNGMPLFIAFYAFNFHLTQLLLFLVIRLWETIDAHSGYDFPFSPWRFLSGAVSHDLHHSANLGNFGMFHFWDWFCQTRTSDLRKSHGEKAD